MRPPLCHCCHPSQSTQPVPAPLSIPTTQALRHQRVWFHSKDNISQSRCHVSIAITMNKTFPSYDVPRTLARNSNSNYSLIKTSHW